MAAFIEDICETERDDYDSDSEFDLVIDEDYLNNRDDEITTQDKDSKPIFQQRVVDEKPPIVQYNGKELKNLSDRSSLNSDVELPVDLSVNRNETAEIKCDNIKKEFISDDEEEDIIEQEKKPIRSDDYTIKLEFHNDENINNNNNNNGHSCKIKLSSTDANSFNNNNNNNNSKCYSCRICDETFRYNVALICHLNIAHNIRFGYDESEHDGGNKSNKVIEQDESNIVVKSKQRKLSRSYSSVSNKSKQSSKSKNLNRRCISTSNVNSDGDGGTTSPKLAKRSRRKSTSTTTTTTTSSSGAVSDADEKVDVRNENMIDKSKIKNTRKRRNTKMNKVIQNKITDEFVGEDESEEGDVEEDEVFSEDKEEVLVESEKNLVQIKLLPPDCSADKQTQTSPMINRRRCGKSSNDTIEDNNNCSVAASAAAAGTEEKLENLYERRMINNAFRKICLKCNKQYNDVVCKQTLVRHAKICRKQFRFSCQFCNMKFLWELKLKKHLYRKHNKTQIFLCHLCSKVFKNDSTLNRHRERCSKTENTYPTANSP